jgi:hypothetical protein
VCGAYLIVLLSYCLLMDACALRCVLQVRSQRWSMFAQLHAMIAPWQELIYLYVTLPMRAHADVLAWEVPGQMGRTAPPLAPRAWEVPCQMGRTAPALLLTDWLTYLLPRGRTPSSPRGSPSPSSSCSSSASSSRGTSSLSSSSPPSASPFAVRTCIGSARAGPSKHADRSTRTTLEPHHPWPHTFARSPALLPDCTPTQDEAEAAFAKMSKAGQQKHLREFREQLLMEEAERIALARRTSAAASERQRHRAAYLRQHSQRVLVPSEHTAARIVAGVPADLSRSTVTTSTDVPAAPPSTLASAAASKGVMDLV